MNKQQAIEQLSQTLAAWEALLASLSEAQIAAARLPDDLSVKDTIAHLRTWQALSVERLEAALHGHPPAYAGWPKGIDPDDEHETDRVNAWILDSHRDWPWPDVHRHWLAGFHRFLDLAARIPDAVISDPSAYPWLQGNTLMDVLTGSFEHHQVDHLDPLQAWLKANPGALG